MFLTGGHDTKRATKTAAKYDTKKNQWTELPNLQQARFNHSMVIVSERLFVIGGAASPDENTGSIELLYLMTQQFWITLL